MKLRLAAAALAAMCLLMSVPGAGAVSIGAQAAILMDAESGRVLYAHHAEEERPIASTTKLMTALVALESTPDLETVIKVRPE